ncbi:MAG: hypothetical protein I3274_04590 [Candidatus Moeniiplasma glomeromycotorum]|nr:hypothetical protein [Candidatus Moeniiplasma glomeromycotorum]
MATINFNDSQKFGTIADIKNYQEKGKDFFDAEEKKCFFFIASVDTAREIGNLLAKIKEAKSKKTWELAELVSTIEELKKEEKKNTLAVREIESNGELLTEAITYLGMRHRFQDEKKLTKEEREVKVKELNTEIGKAQNAQSVNNARIKILQTERDNAFIAKKNEEKLSGKNELILAVLKKDTSKRFKKPDGTGEDTLNNIHLVIKDYKNGNVSKEDNNITDNKGDGTTVSVIDLVDHARTFLDNIKNYSPFINHKSIESPLLSHFFGSRNWNNKHNVGFTQGEVGESLLQVLKDIGAENLKAVVEKVPGISNDEKKDLKDYADEITKFINYTELVDGKGYWEAVSKWSLDTGQKGDEFKKNLMKQGFNEYPYVNIPNWEHIFKFMKLVFPLKSGDTKVEDRKYYSDLVPSDKVKKNFTVYGWDTDIDASEKFTGSGEVPAGKYNSLMRFAQKSNKASQTMKKQVTEPARRISPDSTFKDMVQLWWNIFIPYMEDAYDASKNGWNTSADYDTEYEVRRKKYLEEIRFVRTMRAILKEMGIISMEDEVDEFLLKISSEVRSGAISESDWKKSRQGYMIVLGKDYDLERSNYQSVDHDNAISNAEDLLASRQQRILALESKIESLDKQLDGLRKDNVDKEIHIQTCKSQLALYQEDEEFDNKDLEGKKKGFDDLYNKKTSQDGKWTFLQLKSLEYRLNKIKEEMDDADFTTEYGDKRKEIDDLSKEVAVIWSGFHEWKTALSKNDTKDKAIIFIKKDEAKTGTKLEDIEKVFEKFAEKVKLEDEEQADWDKIKDAIEYPDKYKDSPTSTLKITDLVEVLKGEKELKETDLKTLTAWQATTNFKEKAKIEALVNKYKPGSTEKDQKSGEFKEHLKHEKWGGDWGGKKIEGDNYWEDFVKESPAFIIGAIKHFEWENDTKENKDKITAEMETMNKWESDDKKKKANPDDDKKWDVKKAAHIAQFLYLKAENKSGEQLVKNVMNVEDKPEDDEKDKPEQNGGDKKMGWGKEWFGFGNTGKSLLAYGLILVAVVGIGGAIFWKQIKEWWSGPAEEEGRIGEEGEAKEEVENE